jgi:branched-chain amino acid aminotransferase
MYFNDSTMVFVDGEYLNANDVKVNPYNQTMHYGSGAFEGIRSYDTPDGTRIFKATDHFDRLKYSCEKMYIPFEYSSEELEQITYKLLRLNQLTNAYIRPIVYLDPNMSLTAVGSSHLIIMVWEWGQYLGTEQLKVGTSSFQRPNPKSCFVDAKITGHYTNSILATQEAKNKGFDEALLTDMNGNVAEGPGANFFFEKDGKLYTCPKGNILPGITRQTVFEIAAELKIPVVEKWFDIDEVYNADAAFFCGTAAEIAGIKSLDNHVFPIKWEDTMSELVQRKYKLRVASNEFKEMLI